MAQITWFETTKNPKSAILKKVVGDDAVRKLVYSRYYIHKEEGRKGIVYDTLSKTDGLDGRGFVRNVSVHCGRQAGEYRLSADDTIISWKGAYGGF
jgi:hypothetical protein